MSNSIHQRTDNTVRTSIWRQRDFMQITRRPIPLRGTCAAWCAQMASERSASTQRSPTPIPRSSLSTRLRQSMSSKYAVYSSCPKQLSIWTLNYIIFFPCISMSHDNIIIFNFEKLLLFFYFFQFCLSSNSAELGLLNRAQTSLFDHQINRFPAIILAWKRYLTIKKWSLNPDLGAPIGSPKTRSKSIYIWIFSVADIDKRS